MRLLMISDHASPLAGIGGVDSGGQNVYVDCLSRALAGRGLEVDVCTRRSDASQAEIVSVADRVRVFNILAGPARFVRKEEMLPLMPAFIRRCAALAGCGRYDLAHANFWMSGLTACELKTMLGLPFVVTFHALGRLRRLHQGSADGFPDARIAIEDRIVREADGIVAECPQDAADLSSFYSAEPARTSVIPCGVETETFFPEPKAEARRRLGLPSGARILLQLGRIVPRKGIDTVVHALARLAGEGLHDLMLLVVGGESAKPDRTACPELGRLMDTADELGVRDRVIFTGRRAQEDLRWFYSASDVFVTTPWYEPFGITPLEAMACGTPVIGARVGGIQYSVREGETGLLVPPKDPAALAAAVRSLIETPGLMRRFSEAGRQRVQRFFTWPRVAGQMESLYRAALRRGSASRPRDRRPPAAVPGARLPLAIPASQRFFAAGIAADRDGRSLRVPDMRRERP